jgi:CrcB protein
MGKFLLVFIGSGVGGVIRYSISLFFANVSYKFPWPTFIANAVAAFLVGVFYALATQKEWLDKNYILLLTVGFCGGLSTFSTFSYEGVRLFQTQQYGIAALYVLLSVITGIALCYSGSRVL